MFNVFICHASEDKKKVARPLAQALREAGLRVWYDEFSLKLGDSLRKTIEKGLADSRYGAVILSPSFFGKNWPEAELNGLFAKEMDGHKTILPIWHDINHGDVFKRAPILADKKAARTSQGMDSVIQQILDAVQPELSHRTQKGLTVSATPTSIHLHTGDWTVKTPVKILNPGETNLYSVFIKIAIESGNVQADSIQIEPDSPSTALKGDLSPIPIEVFGDLLIHEVLDKEGKEALMIRIHSLEAKKSRELIVYGSTAMPSTALIRVLSFKTEPDVMLQQPGKVDQPIVLPEPVTLKTVRMRLRRTQ